MGTEAQHLNLDARWPLWVRITHISYADNGSYLDLVGQLHSVWNHYPDKYGSD